MQKIDLCVKISFCIFQLAISYLLDLSSNFLLSSISLIE